MQDPSTELETIVRLVLERVRASESVGDNAEPRLTANEHVASSPDCQRLSQRLVTLEALPERFEPAARVLEVDLRAIVTPAVRDELKQRGVQLRRVEGLLDKVGRPGGESPGQPPVTLVGSGQGITRAVGLARDLTLHAVGGCGDPEREVIAVRRAVEQGCRHVLWATRVPYAAMLAACRTDGVLGVWLPNSSQLSVALDQAQPNVIIIDRSQWSAAALAGLARTWTRRMP